MQFAPQSLTFHRCPVTLSRNLLQLKSDIQMLKTPSTQTFFQAMVLYARATMLTLKYIPQTISATLSTGLSVNDMAAPSKHTILPLKAGIPAYRLQIAADIAHVVRQQKKPETIRFQAFSLAQKEGFEPSRAFYTPTPLAGEPLRPLGYFRRSNSGII